MPPRPRRAPIRPMGRTRRRTTWVNYESVAVVGTAGHSVNSDLLTQYRVAGGEIVGSTILRTHLWLAPTTAVANLDKFSWGLIVAGASQISPSFVTGSGFYETQTFPYVDWMLATEEFACPTFGRLAANNRNVVDIRSKRKINDLGETYIHSISAVTAGAALSVQVYARILLALP